MNEIFISYCRRNLTFAQNFTKALSENGYPADKIWVDWNNIPPSSKWEDEIRKGVEDSNSVIFILSPDWLLSNECAKELQIAAEYNKRLFPIICQNVDPRGTPPELASLNWIFFRETDNFDDAMKKLLAAINTDLDWVAQHTILLKRANEWNTKAQDHSYLLRGSELQEAELWLSKASENKQPSPTPLQSEYVFASRKDAVKRQRNTLIGVSVALVVSIALAFAAVVAGVQALRQSQQALASQLAAQSSNYVDTQPDLSLLLSLEANYIGDSLGESDPALLGSLVTSMNSMPKLGTFLRAHESDVRDVAFSPDGHWLASTGNAANDVGQVFLWDMSSTVKPRPNQKFIGGTQRMLAVAFSQDGKKFVAAGDESKIFVWDPQHCCAPIHEWPVNIKVRGLAFTQVKGHEYIAAIADNQVTFWDSSNGKQESALTLQIPTEKDGSRILSLAISPANDTLVVGSDDGYVTAWDLKTGKQKIHACSYLDPTNGAGCGVGTYDYATTDIRGVAFNADGTLLISGSSDHSVWLWDAHTGENLARSAESNEGGHINLVSSVAFNPKTGQVASVSWDNTVRLWEVIHTSIWELKRVDTLAGHSNSIWAAAYSPNGKWLATGSSDKTVILWKTDQLNQIGTPIDKMDGDVWALAASPDGKHFSAGDTAGNIRSWNVNGGALSKSTTLIHKGGVLALAYSYDNKWLASSGYDNAIRVWNVETGKEAWHIENAHDAEIWAVAFSPDDRWLASAGFDKTAKLWDTATHKQVGDSLKHDDSVYTLDFNLDGTQLLVAGFQLDISIWDLANPTKIPASGFLKGHTAAVNLLAYDPKYPQILASTSDDKTLLIWNVVKKEHGAQVLGLNESMESVAFRPSGDWLASATDNNTVLLWQLDAQRCSENWDKDTCKPWNIGTPLVGHKTAVENVIFLSDTALISSSQDGQIIQWDLDKSHWYQHTCDIVSRPFSNAEYSQYIEGKINVTMLKVASWFSNLFGSNTPQTIPPCISSDSTGS